MYCTHCGCAMVFSFSLDEFLHSDTGSEYCSKDNEHNHPNNLVAFNHNGKARWTDRVPQL